jgi:hypothetical protein
MLGQFTIPVKVTIKTITITIKGTNIVPSQQGCNKAPSDRRPQEVEEDIALEGDTTLNQEDCFAYSTERTRGIQQEPIKLRHKNRKR